MFKEPPMKCAYLFLMSVLLSAETVWGQSPPLLLGFSRVQHKLGEVTNPDKQKLPAGTVELVDGRLLWCNEFWSAAANGASVALSSPNGGTS